MWPTLNQISHAFYSLFHPEEEIARNETRVDAPRVRALCGLTGRESRDQSETRLYQCAERLRSEADYNPARAILHSLVTHSDANSSIRAGANYALRDSLGFDILDEEGNVLVEGSGQTVLWPVDISRNFSDEDGAGTLFESTFLMGGLVGYIFGLNFGWWRSRRNASLIFDRSFDHRQLSAE